MKNNGKLLIISIVFNLVFMLLAGAQNKNSIQQLEPLSPKGSGIYSMDGPPPPGMMPPMQGNLPPMNDHMPPMQGNMLPPPGMMPPMGADTANTSGIHTKYLDVPYGTISKTQTLDIYLPNNGVGPFPVIVLIHGGAFMILNSRGSHEGEIINEATGRGFAVVSINYRLSGEARFPRAVNDAKAAVRFVRAHAQQYKFNPDKIVAWGGSAGGNLSSMLGTTGNVKNLDGDNTENLNYSSAVQAVIDWFGPCDFLVYDEQFKASGLQSSFPTVLRDKSPESLYIGQHVAKDRNFTEKANPETYIHTLDTKTAPYFLIQHGTADLTIPTQQSVDFANLLKAKLGSEKVTLELLKAARHGDPAFSTPENFKKVFAFLDKALQ